MELEDVFKPLTGSACDTLKVIKTNIFLESDKMKNLSFNYKQEAVPSTSLSPSFPLPYGCKCACVCLRVCVFAEHTDMYLIIVFLGQSTPHTQTVSP